MTELEQVNTILKEKYGENAALIEVPVKNKVKYKFVNIDRIARYPYLFKSIESAMKVLILHENVKSFKQLKEYRKTKKSQENSDYQI